MTLDSLFLQNLFSPPLLFFVLGCIATLLKTDLEIPEPIGKLLSLYLLMAIGFKGGVALAANELGLEALTGLFLALLLSVTVPLYVFFILRRSMSPADAAATAATYGSISAVTFVACTSYLDAADIAWNGYLVAAMALMESPAIILGLLLFRLQQSDSTEPLNFKPLLRESFLNSSVFLILGSLAVGWISGERGKAQLAPFVDELFVGVLCLFLLDMGIVAVRRLMDLNTSAAKNLSRLFLFGISLPLLNAGLALTLVTLADLSLGDALLLTVLGASASYIAVPAAMRLALPEANPSLYLTMSLAVTFPFNLLIGIPLYHQILLRIL
jgi:hypothetical protein